jgi:cupin 2 domain-containing protein
LSQTGKEKMNIGNLFADIPMVLDEELFETISATGSHRLERIVSSGHATPAGEWYDQDWDEWVVLLKGRAGLLVEGEAAVRELLPGDYILLPAHLRHRVEWTATDSETIWLALHFSDT